MSTRGDRELARQEWADGYRRLEAEREDAARATARCSPQVDAIAEELRRRVGSRVHARRARGRVPRGPTLGRARRSPSCRPRAQWPAGRDRRDRRRVPPLRARRARLRALSTPAARRRDRRPPRRRGRLRALARARRLRRHLRRWASRSARRWTTTRRPADTQTLVRTLKPLELPPARETVTVTVRALGNVHFWVASRRWHRAGNEQARARAPILTG